ncbi:uncharacterized protein LOC126136592 [Schistocerca cancellata]|uniref:uncharacterized protein LOC126136592 n=1 Tax=Schistocerca cancellata TaxID=274614 RepID=UPI002118CE5F|nr:uncharacterized protein LOC126136592 [Schistocerca cancellata]
MTVENLRRKAAEAEKGKDDNDADVDDDDTSGIAGTLRRWNINPNLVMLKITLFVMYGATAALLPYLTIHMQSIGLTVEEIAFVYLALPFTTFLSPPVTGYLVDKFGRYKPVVIIALVLNAAFHHSLMLIPHMETPGDTPSAYVMRHPDTGKVEVWWSPCPSRECPEEEELDMILASCTDHCLLKEAQPDLATAAPPPQLRRPPQMRPNPPPPASPQLSVPKGCPTLDELMAAAGMAVTPKPLHFLMGWDKRKNRRKNKKAPSFATGLEEPDKPANSTAFILLGMHPDLGKPMEQLGLQLEPYDDESTTQFLQNFGEKVFHDAKVNLTALLQEDLRCGGLVLATNLTLNTLIELTADCMLQKCSFREGGPEVCPPDYKESDDRIFWIYFFLRFLGTTALTAGVTMLDPIALTMIRKYGGHFGRERLFSTLGMAFFAPLVGLFIDQNSQYLSYTDYSAAFYTYDILLAISAVAIALLPLGVQLPADNIMRDLMHIVRLPHVIIFIFFLFFLGNFWGFIESFLFLYLKELGASNYLLGFTVSIGTISSVPFLYGAGDIIKKLGNVNIIILAFFSHAARLMGYSMIESPWWAFPFEIIEATAVHLMWTAAATYCTILAPRWLLATLIGVLGMSHFSLGRGSGSFFGGILIGKIGTRESFRAMGIIAIAGGVAYWLLHRYWLREVEIRNRQRAVEVEEADEAAAATLQDKEGNTADRDPQKEVSISMERLSLVIELNHRGSLTSLDLGSQLPGYRSRRGSCANTKAEAMNQLQASPAAVRPLYRKNSLGAPVTSKLLARKNPPSATVAALLVDGLCTRRYSIPEEDEVDDLSSRTIAVPQSRTIRDENNSILKEVLVKKALKATENNI